MSTVTNPSGRAAVFMVLKPGTVGPLCIDTTDWFIAHYQGETVVTYQLVPSPRENPRVWDTARQEFHNELPRELWDRVILVATLGNNVSSQVVEEAYETLIVSPTESLRNAMIQKKYICEFAACIYEAISGLAIPDTHEWSGPLYANMIFALSRRIRGVGPLYLYFPLRGPAETQDGRRVYRNNDESFEIGEL